MKFSKEELGFILYNNRSKRVVENFFPKNINKYRLTNIENIFQKSKDKFINNKKMVEIPIKDLNLLSNDVLIKPEELSSITNKFIEYKGVFNEKEDNFLQKRKIPKGVIKKWGLLGLSNFKEEELEIIGANVHPIISSILEDGIEGGGIVFPLFDDDNILINNAIRKISLENTDKASLKYSLACPDVSVWKSNDINKDDEIWLTEGLFDMFALDNLGYKSISCSSAMWSGIQLHEVITLKPGKINIFSDNDEVGLRTSAILCDFFKNYGIDCDIFKSKSKDAAQHFFEDNLSIDDIVKVDDIESLIESKSDDSFDFINYLKNRKY